MGVLNEAKAAEEYALELKEEAEARIADAGTVGRHHTGRDMRVEFWVLITNNGAVSARRRYANPGHNEVAVRMLMDIPISAWYARPVPTVTLDVPESAIVYPKFEIQAEIGQPADATTNEEA